MTKILNSHKINSIADNVIAIRRNEEDIYRVEFNIERRLHERIPSRIVRLDIRDILHLFRCEKRNIHIAFSSKDDVDKTDYSKFFGLHYHAYYKDENDGVLRRIHPLLIGSMKGYWRKTENAVIQQKDKEIIKDSDNKPERKSE